MSDVSKRAVTESDEKVCLGGQAGGTRDLRGTESRVASRETTLEAVTSQLGLEGGALATSPPKLALAGPSHPQTDSLEVVPASVIRGAPFRISGRQQQSVTPHGGALLSAGPRRTARTTHPQCWLWQVPYKQVREEKDGRRKKLRFPRAQHAVVFSRGLRTKTSFSSGGQVAEVCKQTVTLAFSFSGSSAQTQRLISGPGET